MTTYRAVYYIYTMFDDEPICVTVSGYESLAGARADIDYVLDDIAFDYNLWDEYIWIELEFYNDFCGYYGSVSEFMYSTEFDAYVDFDQKVWSE